MAYGDTWRKVMAHEKDDNRHVAGDVANTLMDDEIVTIMATADFFGAADYDLAQIQFDLRVARYRVFDWLAMAIGGGRVENESAVKVFTHSFLKVDGDVTAFIEDLRYSDYDIDTSWQSIDLDD